MPRLNNSSQNSRGTTQLSTFKYQQLQNLENKQQQPQLIDAHLPQINQPKKIPPKPPLRKQIRHDPEGIQQMSVTAEFHEKKTFQLAVVQQTHKLALREVPKPPINFNHPQQHLLHQTQSSPSPLTSPHFPNILIFGTQNFHLRHQQEQQMAPNPQYLQQQYQKQNPMSSNMPRMNFMRNQQQVHTHESNGVIVGNYGSAVYERSDPENHIYEMIDECEANGQQPKKKKPEEVARKHDHDGNDLFQNLLRTEMMNQLQLCNGNSLRVNNGFLSHLTHEKRMDIIQETALALASSAYVEK